MTKYGMRPLHTLPALKAMLETAVGTGNYSVECFYEKYRLTVKIIDQDLQKVKGVYDIAAEISPMHIELFLYAEYVGKCEMSLGTGTAVRFITDFYPRFNQETERLQQPGDRRSLSGVSQISNGCRGDAGGRRENAPAGQCRQGGVDREPGGDPHQGFCGL